MKYTKKYIAIAVAVVICAALVTFNAPALAAQATPTITSPSNGGMYTRGNISVTWNGVANAYYRLTIKDTTVNMTVISNALIPMNYCSISPILLYEGHEYKITITATVGTTVTSSSCTIFIVRSSARTTVLDRGKAMINNFWTPTQNLTGWASEKMFYANTTYSGIAYSQENQSTIASVPWIHTSTNFSVTNANFYNNTTSGGGSTQPRYGNDCSGYASICYNISRETTSTFGGTADIGYSGDTKLQMLARLSPGDLLNSPSNHCVVVDSIAAVNDANGNLISLTINTIEQTPTFCRAGAKSTVGTSNLLNSNYVPIVGKSVAAQDYSWAWK